MPCTRLPVPDERVTKATYQHPATNQQRTEGDCIAWRMYGRSLLPRAIREELLAKQPSRKALIILGSVFIPDHSNGRCAKSSVRLRDASNTSSRRMCITWSDCSMTTGPCGRSMSEPGAYFVTAAC